MEHAATKGKKHAERAALRRYLHDIKLKIMVNVYELLFAILSLILYYLFVWEIRHLHTGGSCPVVSGQGCMIDYDQFWSLAGRVAQSAEAMPNFSVFFYLT